MNRNSKVYKVMAAGSKIVSCEIKQYKKVENCMRVHAKFDTGEELIALEFYSDEVSFTPDEFVGLTLREAQMLLVRRINAPNR
jgi:hypothetical protein